MKLTASFGLNFGPAFMPRNAAADGELDGQLLALRAGRRVRGRGADLADMAVGEGGGIELRRLAGLAVVEPQAGASSWSSCSLLSEFRA